MKSVTDLEKINEELNRYNRKKISNHIGCSAGHLSYVLNGKRPLTNEMKDKLFEYLRIA